MPNVPVNHCCGCTACYNICPKGAITMEADVEGFLYPSVDKNLCVNCGLCEKVCPLLNAPKPSAQYADCVIAQNTRPGVLDECTSGGLIDALYQYVTEELRGYAVGVAYDEEHRPVHLIVDSYREAKRFRNSKYAQSLLGDTFQNTRSLLKQGETVIFVGTPCQVAGLKQFLQTEYETLYTVDLVCRSIPSPKLWQEYLRWQGTRRRDKITRVFCRKKTYGYHSGALEIDFQRGGHYAGSNRVDPFMKLFHSDVCSRPSCYDCHFKTAHRCSDLTVFDAWNPQQSAREPLVDNDRGYSNVLAHSEKGKTLLRQLKDVTLIPGDPDEMFRFTGAMERRSIRKKPERDSFYQDLNELGFEKTAKKYVRITPIDRMIEMLKPIMFSVRRKSRQ